MKLPRASAIVASVFGIGYFQFAPGTVMSAIAVPLAILIGRFMAAAAWASWPPASSCW